MESNVNTAATPALALTKPNQSIPLSHVDHLRTQFESIRRQPELAKDLDCFAPGGSLHSIHYIANAHGVHVSRWLKVLAHTQANIAISTANPLPAYASDYVSAEPVLPRWLKIPMVLRYALSGLVLRMTRARSSRGLVHAHCASGNGLVAWLSGQRYVIGTYGSEIYAAKQRGWIYCWLMKQILQGAETISVGSTESTKILVEQFQIPPERIYFFHLGYDDTTFRPLERSQRMQLRRERQLPENEPIWVVNRRSTPHYRTQEVAQGFLEYCQQGGAGRLVLISGDHTPEYTQSICELIASHAAGHRVVVVDRMLSAKELASWLQLGDFSISVPKTDNFSISTLESMGCGTTPILANLEGYELLRPCQPVRWMTDFAPSDFATVFAETAAVWPLQLESQRRECHQFAQNGFSTEWAIRAIAAFYLGTPLRQMESLQRAA